MISALSETNAKLTELLLAVVLRAKEPLTFTEADLAKTEGYALSLDHANGLLTVTATPMAEAQGM